MCAKKLNDKDVMNILIDTALSNGATPLIVFYQEVEVYHLHVD
jgi:hypothetical protein